jgi:two-component system chemotaxis sensor kinase CheA
LVNEANTLEIRFKAATAELRNELEHVEVTPQLRGECLNQLTLAEQQAATDAEWGERALVALSSLASLPFDAGAVSARVLALRLDKAPAPAEERRSPALDSDIIREFVTEGNEQLAECDAKLLELEKNPRDKEALNAVFRSFHTIKGVAGFLNLEELQSTAHAAEDLLDRVRAERLQLAGEAIDLIFEVTGVLKQLIRQIGECLASNQWPPPGNPKTPALVRRIRTLLKVDVTASAPAMSARNVAPAEDAATDDSSGRARNAPNAERSIRVDSERVDHLVDLAGELVIIGSMLNRMSTQGEPGARESRRQMLRLDKMTRELQELAGALRLVPVQGLFRKMARLARDVGKKSQKLISFKVSGEETELDRAVVEKIADPLVHLVRNAIDHGLERHPEERLAQGKPEAGHVWLRALHKSGSIQVEVEDDGRGLNRDAIVKKAVHLGLLRAGEAPTDEQAFALICEPGFSTAAQVTELSGRGVGMDVVKRNIDAMGGVLKIHSVPGKGTRFVMQLPLTLAVIDGMLVRAGNERYVIPTLSIIKLVEPRVSGIATVLESHELLDVQGQMVPMLRLTTLFGFSRSEDRVAVVTEAGGQRVALMVDELVGQQQAVIKSLGQGIAETPGISGCAILSDGRVGLVLDIGGLLRLAGSRSAAKATVSSPALGAGTAGVAAWMS